MDDTTGYAVYFFPPALEALGDAIKPYLLEGPGGSHVLCREIDTGGALIEMTLDGMDGDGKTVETELMVPSNMVRMIVSARSDGAFGFGPRSAAAMALPLEAPIERLAARGPTAAPSDAPSESFPADIAPTAAPALPKS